MRQLFTHVYKHDNTPTKKHEVWHYEDEQALWWYLNPRLEDIADQLGIRYNRDTRTFGWIGKDFPSHTGRIALYPYLLSRGDRSGFGEGATVGHIFHPFRMTLYERMKCLLVICYELSHLILAHAPSALIASSDTWREQKYTHKAYTSHTMTDDRKFKEILADYHVYCLVNTMIQEDLDAFTQRHLQPQLIPNALPLPPNYISAKLHHKKHAWKQPGIPWYVYQHYLDEFAVLERHKLFENATNPKLFLDHYDTILAAGDIS